MVFQYIAKVQTNFLELNKSGMKKLIQRLLIFFIGAPIILSIFYFLPQYNFLAYHLLVVLVGCIGTFEIYNIISQRLQTYPPIFICIFGTLFITAAYLIGLNIFSRESLFDFFGLLLVLLLGIEIIFSFSGIFTHSISRLATGTFMFIYPWIFAAYLSRLTIFKNPEIVLVTFFMMVFATDSIAWFFGVLFGNNNRGLIKASPKKSIAGFIGGFIGSIFIGYIVHKIFYKQFSNYLVELLIIGAVTSIAAILGDIVESILKRSADVKDSGNMILGRGGVLDSLDSVLLSAPVFYVAFKYLIR